MVRVLLIRHTEVAAHWKGRCYGQSDVGLSSVGRRAARSLAEDIADRVAIRIVSSPLRRARFLAGSIAWHATGRDGGDGPAKPDPRFIIEPRLAECNFGAWEGRPWSEIYAETGAAMMGMIAAPGTFRPGGDGETTYELRNRAMDWLTSLPLHEPVVVAVAHGGPIAAIRGTLAGSPAQDWPTLVPAYGEVVEIEV